MPNPEIAPALVERAIALVRKMASKRSSDGAFVSFSLEWMREAASLNAELPAPVDPDLLLAREVAGDAMAAHVFGGQQYSTGSINAVRTGNDDSTAWVVSALAAIKRVRQQEKG